MSRTLLEVVFTGGHGVHGALGLVASPLALALRWGGEGADADLRSWDLEAACVF